PKAYLTRTRLAVPGTTDYWVNDTLIETCPVRSLGIAGDCESHAKVRTRKTGLRCVEVLTQGRHCLGSMGLRRDQANETDDGCMCTGGVFAFRVRTSQIRGAENRRLGRTGLDADGPRLDQGRLEHGRRGLRPDHRG